MNIGEAREKVYTKAVNGKATAHNTHAIDGIYPDGTTYEFKTLVGSKPSLGGKKTLQGQTDIRKAIETYLKADYLVIETASGHYLKMNRAEAVNWLTARVTIGKASSSRGGWYKLRILKNPRTAESTEAIRRAGFTIGAGG